MNLCFDFYRKGKYYGVNIWLESSQSDLFDQAYSREYLEESQYDRVAKWCSKTFNTEVYPNRVRRMAYADFWFSSQRDLDWFLLNWSGVDSTQI